jgi:threonine aldolase
VAPDVTDPAHAPTNIVVLDLSGHRLDAAGLASAAAERGVRVSVLGPRSARLVTHLDVDTDSAKRAADVLAGLLSAD